MVFHGFQKMTLLDFPGRVACTLFTGGCNLRCPFCHNAPLVTDIDGDSALYREEEIFTFLKRRVGLLDGVAVTGGEPLLHKDLPAFLSRVKEMGFAVKLDTNGTFPDRLREIVSAGLADYVAVDIKNCPDEYARTCGLEKMDISPVLETVEYLLSDVVPYEFRTTLVAGFHTPERVAQIASLIKGAKHYYLQNFKDSGRLICPGLSALPLEELQACLAAARKYVPGTELRGVDILPATEADPAG
ncbi:MAG: anaerobic ribonucleoside-triphosphate reductase activating protein [Clostridia bacterium]|nr:anaerobic ribonucleoside-triphosphate reductase activating protein [Clostridia bacterium]